MVATSTFAENFKMATSAKMKGAGRDSRGCWSLSHWILVGVIWVVDVTNILLDVRNGWHVTNIVRSMYNKYIGIKRTFSSWRKVAFKSFVEREPRPFPWTARYNYKEVTVNYINHYQKGLFDNLIHCWPLGTPWRADWSPQNHLVVEFPWSTWHCRFCKYWASQILGGFKYYTIKKWNWTNNLHNWNFWA